MTGLQKDKFNLNLCLKSTINIITDMSYGLRQENISISGTSLDVISALFDAFDTKDEEDIENPTNGLYNLLISQWLKMGMLAVIFHQ